MTNSCINQTACKLLGFIIFTAKANRQILRHISKFPKKGMLFHEKYHALFVIFEKKQTKNKQTKNRKNWNFSDVKL